jgi:hypothetical protein
MCCATATFVVARFLSFLAPLRACLKNRPNGQVHCTTITRDSGKLVCPIYAAFKNQTWREIHLAVCLARLFFTRVSWLPNGFTGYSCFFNQRF